MKLRPLPNTVVHLKTQAEYDEYMQMCEDAGWVWGNGKPVKEEKNNWRKYKEKTYCSVENRFMYGFHAFSSVYYPEKIITLRELKAVIGGKAYIDGDGLVKTYGKQKPSETWTLDAPIYRRGSDWIREDKMCIDGKEWTFDEVCEQEAKFRAFRRAHSRYFPKAR